jgi:hypothetical protein
MGAVANAPRRGEPDDPLLYNTPLPLEAGLFPMGRPLRIATNSHAVIECARRLWERYPKLSAQGVVSLKIAVSDTDREMAGGPPVLRGQDHLVSMVGGRNNFAAADLRGGNAFACFTRDVASHAAGLRYHYLEPLAYVLVAARHFTLLHASCVALNGRAIVLCGESGAGKTCLAFACALKGWTFLSGDAIAIVRSGADHRVAGRPFEIRFRREASRLFPQLAAVRRVLRPNGKADLETDPQELGLSCAVEAEARAIVFLDRVSGPATTALEPFPRDEAFERTRPSICFGDQALREEQTRALERFLTLPTHRLRYSMLDSAERVLRRLVENGR